MRLLATGTGATKSFLAALPLHPVAIWLTKLASAAVALASVHIAIALLGLMTGYHQLTMFVIVTRMPRLIVFVLLLASGCTLVCSALFKRAFSILAAGCLMTFFFSFVSAWIQMFWQWRSMMEWPLATGLITMTIVSATAYTAELRRGELQRRFSWPAFAGILLLMTTALFLQYIHVNCRAPAIAQAEIVEWIPGLNRFIIASSMEGPLFELNPDDLETRRISLRFESIDRDEISPDGRSIIVYNHRGYLGSYDYSDLFGLIEDDWFKHPARPLSNLLWQDPQDGMIAGFGSSIRILNLETGSRTEIGEGPYGIPLQAMWYDRSDNLAVMFFTRSEEGKPGNTSIVLMKSDASFIRYLAEPRKSGFISISDDRSTLSCTTLLESKPGDPPAIETRFKTILDSEWTLADNPRSIPSVSPDHKWMLSWTSQTDNGMTHIVIKSPDGTTIPAGETRNDELARWSPGSRFLVFTRNADSVSTTIETDVPNITRREIAVFDTIGRSITPLPEKSSEVFDSEFAAWSSRVIFSPDETRFALIGHSPDASIIVYPAPDPDGFYLIPASQLLGWLDNSTLLFRKKTPEIPPSELRSGICGSSRKKLMEIPPARSQALRQVFKLDIETGKELPFLPAKSSSPRG